MDKNLAIFAVKMYKQNYKNIDTFPKQDITASDSYNIPFASKS